MTRDRARKKAIRARMAADGEPYNVAARKLTTPSTPSTPSVPSVPVSAGEVAARADATLAASSARIEFRVDVARTEPGPGPRRPGPIGRLVARSARAAWARLAPGEDLASLRDAFAHPVAAGFIEPAAGRYLMDYGHYAVIYRDGQHFGGRSGTPLQGRHRDRRLPETDTPLTLLRRPHGATGARHVGDEPVRGTPCRVIAVTGAGLAELTVWIDDEHIRRIRCEERAEKISRTATLELWDFGVPVDSLDWSRLPSFRSPGQGPAS